MIMPRAELSLNIMISNSPYCGFTALPFTDDQDDLQLALN